MKLRVLATPNARLSEILGWTDDPRAGRCLKVRIAAPPLEGKANTAITNLLAQALHLPKSRITLEKGDTSRVKTFTLPDHTTLPW